MTPTVHDNHSKEFEKDPAGFDTSASVAEIGGRNVPEDISALSEEEYNAIVKKIVRKADCVIMLVPMHSISLQDMTETQAYYRCPVHPQLH